MAIANVAKAQPPHKWAVATVLLHARRRANKALTRTPRRRQARPPAAAIVAAKPPFQETSVIVKRITRAENPLWVH